MITAIIPSLLIFIQMVLIFRQTYRPNKIYHHEIAFGHLIIFALLATSMLPHNGTIIQFIYFTLFNLLMILQIILLFSESPNSIFFVYRFRMYETTNPFFLVQDKISKKWRIATFKNGELELHGNRFMEKGEANGLTTLLNQDVDTK